MSRIKDAWLFARVPSEADVTRVRTILARPHLPEQLQLDLPGRPSLGPYRAASEFRLVRSSELSVIQAEVRLLRSALKEADQRLAERGEEVRRLCGALRQARSGRSRVPMMQSA